MCSPACLPLAERLPSLGPRALGWALSDTLAPFYVLMAILALQ